MDLDDLLEEFKDDRQHVKRGLTDWDDDVPAVSTKKTPVSHAKQAVKDDPWGNVSVSKPSGGAAAKVQLAQKPQETNWDDGDFDEAPPKKAVQ